MVRLKPRSQLFRPEESFQAARGMEEKLGLEEGICSPFTVILFGASLTRSPGKLVGRGVGSGR